MNLADFSSAVQLALRRTNWQSPRSGTRSRSPTRNQITCPASSSTAVARARSKSPSRALSINKSLLDLVRPQGATSSALPASPTPPVVQRVHTPPKPTTPIESTLAVAKPSSAFKAPLSSNSPTLSYLILIIALVISLLAPTSFGLPLGAAAPLPSSSNHNSAPTSTPEHLTSLDAYANTPPSVLAWFPKLWRSLWGTAPGSLSTGGVAADPLESMVALFGPWDDDEWQDQITSDSELDREHEHLDAEEAWFHCGAKARFMAGLRKANAKVIVSAPKCPKSQSTSARVVSSDGNDRNRVHITSDAGLPVETAYLSAESLRGTLLYSRPAMVTPHAEL